MRQIVNIVVRDIFCGFDERKRRQVEVRSQREKVYKKKTKVEEKYGCEKRLVSPKNLKEHVRIECSQ